MLAEKSKRIGKVVWASLVLAMVPAGVTGQSVREAREIYMEYIAIRKLIGEEKSSWDEQKLTLQDMVEVLEVEIEQTKDVISHFEQSASTADIRRRELTENLEKAKAASEAYNERIAAYEMKIRPVIAKLPDMLGKEIAPLVARLPDNPDNSRLSYSQRIQTIVGILTQIDKFNSDLRTVSEVKSLDGSSQEVQTLYFGLAVALYSNASGTHAGYGRPGEVGWEWTSVEGEEAQAILEAIDIYAARRAPAFVSVPLAAD